MSAYPSFGFLIIGLGALALMAIVEVFLGRDRR